MQAFGKDEMEILGSKHDLIELHDLMFQIAYFLIDRDIVLHDGATLGNTEEQKLPIVRSEGVSVEGMNFKIAY